MLASPRLPLALYSAGDLLGSLVTSLSRGNCREDGWLVGVFGEFCGECQEVGHGTE